jgi:actin-related protein 6
MFAAGGGEVLSCADADDAATHPPTLRSARNFAKEAVKPASLEYVLPDHATELEGRVLRPGETLAAKRQKVRLGIERILVPEVLFDPSRIALPQAGLAEAIAQSISSLPRELHAAAFDNILVSGGSARLPGFLERLESELEPYRPQGSWGRSAVEHSADACAAWRGGALFASAPGMEQHAVTRQEYLEFGSSLAVAAKQAKWINLGGA